MKAYKQINVKRETSWVWTYASVLILLGVVVMFKPVLAQLEEHQLPGTRIEVKKEYDENGNLAGIDSVMSRTWSGSHFSFPEMDSLFNGLEENFQGLFPRNFNGYHFHTLPPGPPLHRYWGWNDEDSSAFSRLHEFFDESFLERFQESFVMPDQLSNHHFPGFDSLGFSMPGMDNFAPFDDDEFSRQFEDFNERFRQYQEEHRQLIEKYFRQPKNAVEQDAEIAP